MGNKYAIGNKGGQPRFYKTPEELARECNKYFEYIKGVYRTVKKRVWDEAQGKRVTKEVTTCIREREPATITGLVIYLGFAHRQSLDDYEKLPGYSDIIRRARTRVANAYEQKLHEGKAQGPMFALKNINGWRDHQDVQLSTPEDKPFEVKTTTTLNVDYSKLPTHVLDALMKAQVKSDE
jgi:hypothetical protein